MDNAAYHVVLEGRKVGPYDRRTILGMRIKKTLTSEHVLIGQDGARLTVADLIAQGRGREAFNPARSGSFSLVQARFSASMVAVASGSFDIPRFRGEVEARVQADVLRLAGRYRQGLRRKEGRVKIPLQDVVHAQLRNSQVDLWLRPSGALALQQLSLELFTPEAAGELVGWLPMATPLPESVEPAAQPRAAAVASHHMVWVALTGIVVVVGLVLAVVLFRRLY